MGRGEGAINVLTVAVGDVEEGGEEFGERGQCQRDEVDGFLCNIVDRDGLTVRSVLFTEATGGRMRRV